GAGAAARGGGGVRSGRGRGTGAERVTGGEKRSADRVGSRADGGGRRGPWLRRFPCSSWTTTQSQVRSSAHWRKRLATGRGAPSTGGKRGRCCSCRRSSW